MTDAEQSAAELRHDLEALVALTMTLVPAADVMVDGPARTLAEEARLEVVAELLRRRLGAATVRVRPESTDEESLSGPGVVVRLVARGARRGVRGNAGAKSVVAMAVDSDLDVDPVVVAPLVFEAEVLAARRQALRLGGQLPPEGELLVASLRTFRGGRAGPGVRRLLGVADALGLALVICDAPPRTATWSLEGGGAVDLAAALDAASLVVTDDPALVSMAAGFGRPAVGVALAGRPGLPHDWEAHIRHVPSLEFTEAPLAPPAPLVAALQVAAGENLDAAALAVGRRLARSARSGAAACVRGLEDELRILRLTCEGLRVRQRAEREQFGIAASALLANSSEAARSAAWVERSALEDRVAELEETVDALRVANAALEEERGEYHRLHDRLDHVLDGPAGPLLRRAEKFTRRTLGVARPGGGCN